MHKAKIKKIVKNLDKNNKNALKDYKKSGVVRYIEILPADNSCNACKEWKGKRIALDRVIRERLLPIKSCNNKDHGYCRCCYMPVVE